MGGATIRAGGHYPPPCKGGDLGVNACNKKYSDEPSEHVGPVHNIKPMCPTRWFVRTPAVKATLQQYQFMLQDAQLTCSSDVSVRAASTVNFVMCFTMAQHVIEPLESLNKSLQSTKMTVAGMLESAKTARSPLQSLQKDGKYGEIFNEAEQMIQ